MKYSREWWHPKVDWRSHERSGQALVGDATGYCHPITATGMKLGFKDAIALTTSKNFDRFRQDCLMNTYVPEWLAHALYQVVTHQDETAIALRQAIYQMWQQDPDERQRTMQLLATMETKLLPFSRSFLKGLKIAIDQVIQQKTTLHQWRQIFQVLSSFGGSSKPTLDFLSHFLSRHT